MRLLLSLAASISLFTACAPSSSPPESSPSSSSTKPSRTTTAVTGETIAKIGNTTITVEQMQKKIDEQSPFVRVRYTDPAKKKEFLDSQVRFEVLAAEAFARGMDQDPEVLEATKKIIVQKLTRDEFDGRVKLTDVADAELQKYFDEHTADYQKPEVVRASHLAIAFGQPSTAASKAAAKKQAEDAHKKASTKEALKDRNFFKELVAAVSSDESTKRAGGDLRYLAAPEFEERFGAAARAWLFSSEGVNEVSPVIEGKDAWHVFLRTGNRKEITRTFDQVKNQIKNVVFREKRTAAFNKLVDDLKSKHGVTVYEDKLDKVKVNAQLPPGVMDDGHGHGAHPAPPTDDLEGEGAPAPEAKP